MRFNKSDAQFVQSTSITHIACFYEETCIVVRRNVLVIRFWRCVHSFYCFVQLCSNKYIAYNSQLANKIHDYFISLQYCSILFDFWKYSLAAIEIVSGLLGHWAPFWHQIPAILPASATHCYVMGYIMSST